MAVVRAQKTFSSHSTAASASGSSYDVFLSFRGEDTRKTFTDHLYTALVNAGFRTFRDDPELDRGENITQKLEKAIQQSRASVIVFSKDYSSSSWCLDELVMILERKRTSDHVVLPVFYDVQPSDLRKQAENLAKIPKYQKIQSPEKLNGWQAALTEVTDLAGMLLQNQAYGHESMFIQNIVSVIQDKLYRRMPLSFVQEVLLKKLLSVIPVLDDAEGKQLNNPTVKDWLNDLKEAVYDARDLLQETKREALREKMEPESGSSTSKVQDLVSSPPFHALDSASIMSRVEEVLQRLDFITEQRKDVMGLQASSMQSKYMDHTPSKRRRINLDWLTTQEASSSSASTHSWTYDVFLSFINQDTCNNFVDHLHSHLVRKGINTFVDTEITRGEDISQSLFRVIEGSRISLIVFSENYASSKWCLDELVHILECRRSKKQIVRPIFYKVDPSDVRNQRGSFGNALANHETNFKGNMDRVRKWRAALSEAANMFGWHFSHRYESKFIQEIGEEISSQVNELTYLNVAKCPIGLNSRVQDMLNILDVGGSDVRMVGIWGTGGIGKTTIAKAVYKKITHKFEGSCFLSVKEESEAHGGLLNLQNILLSKIVWGKELMVTNVYEGLLNERLRRKRILLVLDDVNKLEQLNKLAGALDWFGCGSRIIITTRDYRLLIAHQVNPIYKARELYHHEACFLLSAYAFENKTDLDEDKKLSVNAVVGHAQGLPLALVVLGSHLCGRPIHQWQAVLDVCKRSPLGGIQKILKISYDALENPEKEVFLDIACFFKHRNKNYVIQILEGCDYNNPTSSIKVLEERALINVEYGCICMHDLLEEMGKEIVCEESPKEPSERSRLWYHKVVLQVLTENTATHITKGIREKLSKPHEIPSSATELVEFRSIKIQNLTSINIESCQFLKEIPDMSGIPNLRILKLDCCTNLVKIDDSVGFLEKLVQLSLSGCHKLNMFPRTIALKSVEHINIRGCRRLEIFPEIMGEMESLKWLDLSGTAIKELPSSIGFLINLEELIMEECENLTNLPSCIYELPHLWCLNLQYCSKLVMLPRWNAESLPTKSTISPDLWYLNLRGCKRLREIPQLPPRVQWLNAADCVQLESFAILSSILEHKESEMIKCLVLSNCQRLCVNLVHDLTKVGRNILNEVSLCSLFLSCTQSEFEVVFPGNEIPRWFSHHKHLNFLETSKLSFEIPLSFKLGNKGLAICAAVAVETTTPKEKGVVQSNLGNSTFTANIDINGESIVTRSLAFEAEDVASAHVWLCYIPFIVFAYHQLPPFTCGVRVEYTSQGSVRCKSYGVHLVIPGDEDEYEEGLKDEDIENAMN